jgi:hypothetical protein
LASFRSRCTLHRLWFHWAAARQSHPAARFTCAAAAQTRSTWSAPSNAQKHLDDRPTPSRQHSAAWGPPRHTRLPYPRPSRIPAPDPPHPPLRARIGRTPVTPPAPAEAITPDHAPYQLEREAATPAVPVAAGPLTEGRISRCPIPKNVSGKRSRKSSARPRRRR